MKKIIYILSVGLLLISCSKDPIKKETIANDFSRFFGNSQKTDNQVSFHLSNIRGTTNAVRIFKNFKKEGELQVYNNTRAYLEGVPPFTKRPGTDLIDPTYETFSKLENESDFEKAKNLFGKKQVLTFGSKTARGVNNPTEEMYFPEGVSLEDTNDLEKLNKNEDLVISWNPDPKNDIQKVVILIINRGNLSTLDENTKIKDASITKVVDDTGKCVIPKNELQQFDKDCNLDIIISRGNQKISQNTTFTVFTTDLMMTKVE